MSLKHLIVILSVTALMAASAPSAGAFTDHSQIKRQGKSKTSSKGPAKKEDEKPFSEMIKDKVAINGLFTFYYDSTDNSMLMAINPDQFDKVFLCGETRTGGDGEFAEGSLMNQTFPFFFKRVGKSVMLLEKNVRFSADSTSSMKRALQSGISDALVASTTVKSLPQDSTNAILIDPSPLFVRDAENINFFLGSAGQTGISFDQKNSYFTGVRSFPKNTEIGVKLHFKTSRPQGGDALQNPYSFFHTYNYSLSEILKTDYVPRLADDRVGHFMTLIQDYSKIETETPYVRYINRWNLKKKNPEARISEPVNQIVYWIENTTPVEYRDAIARGIEYWNQSFEKIGFRNAIVAKVMPDTATWDPADIRYSVVRWSITKNSPYAAIGPSRANPMTGEIFDADINLNSDFVRNAMLGAARRVKPLSYDGVSLEEPAIDLASAIKAHINDLGHRCAAGSEGAFVASHGLAYLIATTDEKTDKDSLSDAYVKSFLTFVVSHEVGHTLGFRHNFESSSIYTFDQINDPAFSSVHGQLGTVMDYPAPNIAGVGTKQGDFYTYAAGPYDDWIIAYSYSDLGSKTPQDETDKLKEIANRASEAGNVYGTDEDAFGLSAKGIDPYCNIWDIGSDPIDYFERSVAITQTIWTDAIKKFEQPGKRYQDILFAFQNGWSPYLYAAAVVPKFVGGIRHSRMHVGDKDGELPFTPIPAKEQRRAMAFLRDKIFAADAFNLSNYLLNKLQPEQFQDFSFSAFSVQQVDYPLHQQVLSVQNSALNKLYHPLTLGRLLNNTERVKSGDDMYTMYEMFSDVRKAIWSEAENNRNVNSFRRQLQLSNLNQLIGIYLSTPAQYPSDARTLAGNDLDAIKASATRSAGSTAVDGMSQAHFKEVVRQINAAQQASREYGSN
ncbi:MAG: zinc-dependent metalloprotease [candidate division Zixibacteria bacterium]|nr:zinc-dependent metalloprotease [candidate division Zixibacteria bacterium]